MGKIKVKCWGDHKPRRANAFAAGIDLINNGESVTVVEGEYTNVETKTAMQIPDGYVGLVVVRSGFGFKGLSLINSVGVIDSDYRGEIGVRLISHSKDPIEIPHGERFAQIVIVPCSLAEVEYVDELTETERGESGFGSNFYEKEK